VDFDFINKSLSYDSESGVLTWRVGSRAGKEAGCLRSNGGKYRVVRVANVLLYAHRLAWLLHYGAQPRQVIDHINGDGSDNRIANLRDVSPVVNSQNQRKAKSNNKKSGLLGVQRNHKGWQAVISIKGERKCLGTFKTPELAYERYIEMKRQAHVGCTL
jgi:hypothetical protein